MKETQRPIPYSVKNYEYLKKMIELVIFCSFIVNSGLISFTYGVLKFINI